MHKSCDGAKRDEYLVQRLFQEQARCQRDLTDTPTSAIIPFLVDWAHNHRHTLSLPLKICDFGGGRGFLLKELHDKLGDKCLIFNAEKVEAYRSRQVSEAINFVLTSILDCGLANDYFDVVTARFLFHHLIGKTIMHNQTNVRRAITELLRVVKPGGLVLVEEIVNQSPWANKILYHLSRLGTKLNLRIALFEVTPYTIVQYMTQEELVALFREFVPSVRWLAQEHINRSMSICWKMTCLMNDTRIVFIALQKPFSAR